MAKRVLWATALMALFVADLAQAQQGGPGSGKPSGQPGARPGADRPEAGERPGPVTKPVPGRPGVGGPQIQPPRPGRPRPPRPQPPRPVRPQPPHRPGAGRPPHFRPIHANPYRYPRGYAYRRWTIGLLLPSLLRSSAYYYDGYSALGVGRPPKGYRWVRYGPDLLLVNVRTGRISDVIYGAFN